MKFFSQSFTYDDPWSIVSLAFFLRYPNPHAAHVLSCDVIERVTTAHGTLRTTRLILKRGNLPRWAPKGIMSRAESWVLEESEVDPLGRTVACTTRNLDHVKVMSVRESVTLRPSEDGSKTIQKTQVSMVSRFGWGFTNRIEDHGMSKLHKNLQRSREGISVVLNLLRQQPMAMGLSGSLVGSTAVASPYVARRGDPSPERRRDESTTTEPSQPGSDSPRWMQLRSWLGSRA